MQKPSAYRVVAFEDVARGDPATLAEMEIPRDIADAEQVPADLDSSVVGPYSVPSPRRRRRAGHVYLGGALVAVAAGAGGLGWGFFVAAAGLALIGGFHLVAAWPLPVREQGALTVATKTVDFAVGHASAAVGFTGWRARPVWNVLVFSADEPPTRRALVRVDGVTGAVIESYVEDVPRGG